MSLSPIANILQIKYTNMTKALLKKIYDTIGKRMIAIDINKNYEVGVLERLAPYSLGVKKMDYINSNGSIMVMCVFRLNTEELQN